MLFVFTLSALLFVPCHLAFKIPDSGSVVANLWSEFELQLQDAVFQALDRHERHRRAAPIQDVWTGFVVPDLHQHRDRLVVDSVNIVSSSRLNCVFQRSVLLDSVQHQRRHYTSTACGNSLSLYRLNSTTLQQTDAIRLTGDATSLEHFKLFDPESGQVFLFFLVLTPRSLQAYRVKEDKLELSVSQQLVHEFTGVQVFEVDGVIFCKLDKKADNQIRSGIFKLAISNGQVHFDLVTTSSFSDDSPIQICTVDGRGHLFHYDVDMKRLSTYLFDTLQLEHHQIFEADGVKDFQCFRIGSTHYLAFATFQSMKIFQYVDGFYEALQTLPLEGVSVIKPVSPPTYRDDTFLLISGFNETAGDSFIDILLLDASSLTFVPLHASCSHLTTENSLPHKMKPADIGCLTAMENLDFSSLTSIILDQQLLLVISDGSVAWLLTVDVHLESVENPVARQLVGVQERIDATSSAAQKASTKSREFLEFSKGIVLYDSDVRLEGSWKVGTIDVPEVTMETLNQSKVDFNPDSWIPGLDVIVDDLQKKMNELERLLDDIDGRLQGTIQNGTHDSVDFGHLIVDGSLLMNQLEVTKMSIEKLNGLPFDLLVTDVVRLDSERMIESLVLMGTLTTEALSAKQINGILVEDVLVRSDQQPKITGNLTINNNVSVVGDVIVGGTVNGIDFSRELLTSNDTHDSIKFTDDVVVVDLSVKEYMNGVNATHVLPNVVVDKTLDVHLDNVHFDHLMIEGNLEIKSGKVNDIDIMALNASAIRLDTEQLIEGSIVFKQGVTAQKFLQVETLNGINFEDFIVKTTSLDDIVMTGEKVFLGNVTTRLLNVEKKVNNHNLHNALTLDTNQTVNGSVHLLDGFEVPAGDLTVETVNGVDWKAVREHGVHPAILKLQGLNKNVTIRNLCSIGGSLAAVHFKVNGERLEDLLEDIVYANGYDILITGHKKFSSLKLNSLQVDGYINNLKLLEELLTSSTDQTISGRYDFQRYVDFSALDVKGRLNQYDLDELLGSVLQFDDTFNSVTCRLRFNHVSVSDQIIVNGSINGFPTELMVLDGVDQTFTAPQKLVSPDFSSLKIGGNLNTTDASSYVNGLDLDLFDRRRVTVSTDQWIKGAWMVDNISGDTLSFRTLNGLPVNEWNSSFVHAHSPTAQIIDADGFDIHLLEVRGSITTSLNRINGYDLHGLSQVAGDIRNNLIFNTSASLDHLESKQIHVNGTVNDYFLQRLKDDVVHHNQKPRITGVKKFKTVQVKGDVDAALVNGRRLIDSFLHISADQKIESPIKFADQVIAGDIKMIGDSATLNGVPNSLLFSSHTLTHNIHHGDIIFDQQIDVDSLEIKSFQGENWEQLVSSLARIDDTNMFTGTVAFSNPVKIEGALTVAELNGVNVKKFVDDVVLIDVDANITSRKNFHQLETIRLSTQNISSDSVYPDIISTARNAIRLDVNEIVNGTMVFDSVTVNQNVKVFTLNDQPFPSGFVTLDTDQELPDSMEVERLIMLGDILLEDGARVNGFDLKAECANTWMVDGDDKIQSHKIFQGQIDLLGNLTVTQKVNGISDFDKEVVMLANVGALYGAPHFKDLTVRGNVVNVGLTNDIDLADLASRALYLDEPINTDAVWSIENNPTLLHGGNFLLPVEAKINDSPFNVGQLTGSASLNEPRILKAEERNVYNAALQWHDALRGAYFKMDHLDFNQTINLPHQVTALSELQMNNTSLLFIGTRGGSMVYSRKSNESSYNLAGIPPDTGNVSKWLSLPPDFAASLSTTGAKLWRIVSSDPFRMDLIEDFGPNVMDITDEAIHNLRTVDSSKNSSKMISTVASLNGVQVYERMKTPTDMSNSTGQMNSDYKMHNFRLGSRSMIALIMTFSPEVSANVVGCPGVRLFSTSTGSMKLEHIIPACDVRAITTFSHGNLPDEYLLLAEHEAVIVYHYQGASGYVEHFRLPYPTATALHSWSIKSESDSDLLVAVAKSDRVAIHNCVTVGDYIMD